MSRKNIDTQLTLTFDPVGLYRRGPLTHGFLSVKSCTVFSPWLAVPGRGGLAVGIELHHFIPGTFPALDFGIVGGRVES